MALNDGGGLNVLSASNVDARQAEEGSRAAFHIERTSNYKMTTYHGTSRAELSTGVGLFVTDDYDTAVSYALDRWDRTGWVHQLDLIGRIADPDDLGAEVTEPTDLYDSDLWDRARRAGYAAIAIDETHYITHVTSTTLVVVDEDAIRWISAEQVADE